MNTTNLDDFNAVPPGITLDPADWVNRPLIDIIRIMKYYVLNDPLHLNFSAEFLRCSYGKHICTTGIVYH